MSPKDATYAALEYFVQLTTNRHWWVAVPVFGAICFLIGKPMFGMCILLVWCAFLQGVLNAERTLNRDKEKNKK